MKGKNMTNRKGVKRGKQKRKSLGNIEENAKSEEKRREKKDESTKKRLQIEVKSLN